MPSGAPAYIGGCAARQGDDGVQPGGNRPAVSRSGRGRHNSLHNYGKHGGSDEIERLRGEPMAADQGWLTKAGTGLADNVHDALTMGAGFPLRHLSDKLGRPRYVTAVKGCGRVSLRAGSSDGAVFRQVFAHREYDLGRFPQHGRVLAAIERALAEGRAPVIVDGGANVGAASLYFARAYPQATVVAIEPDPDNAESCERNTAGCGNVKVLRAALGAEPGAVELFNPAGEAWAVQTSRSSGGSTEVVTIDQAVGDGAPVIVKIDIEGFEADLFSSNTGWIDRAAAVIVEPHDWLFPDAASSRALQRAMGERDFDMVISGENLVYFRRDPAA